MGIAPPGRILASGVWVVARASPMAIRLGKLLGNGPEIWLRMQQTLDLWELERG